MGQTLEYMMTIFENSAKSKGIRSILPATQADPDQTAQLKTLNETLAVTPYKGEGAPPLPAGYFMTRELHQNIKYELP